jgi:hypothetical protein
MMNSRKALLAVNPAPGFRRDRVAGVQKPLVFLVSGVRRNDRKRRSLSFCEFTKYRGSHRKELLWVTFSTTC